MVWLERAALAVAEVIESTTLTQLYVCTKLLHIFTLVMHFFNMPL